MPSFKYDIAGNIACQTPILAIDVEGRRRRTLDRGGRSPAAHPKGAAALSVGVDGRVHNPYVTGIRIAELLALEIGKHISPDCTVVYIRQQRTRKGEIAPTAKTDAGYRDVDVHPLVAKMLREYIGNRKSGFLLETETGNMLWPGTLYRDGLKTILRDMARFKVRFHASVDSDKPCLKRAKCGSF
jgi:integrase